MPTLTTLETTKHLLALALPDTTNDGILLGLIEAEEKRFIGDVGWDILTASYTDYFYGGGGCEKTFDRRPVTAITSLSTQNSFSSDTWTAISTNDYKLRNNGSRYWITYPGGFGEDVEYKLVYTAGYAATAIPEDIQFLIAAFSAIAFDKSDRGTNKDRSFDLLSKSTTTPGGSKTEVYGSPTAWWNGVVARYRRTLI